MATLTYTGSLMVTKCWCGINLAVPQELYDLAKRHKGQSIYCPLGHAFVYGDTMQEKLAEAKRQFAEEQRRRRAVADLLSQEERSHAATRGHVTRKRKQLARVKAGVCPCCSRSFANLARHMANQHPEFQE